jgi:importin-5
MDNMEADVNTILPYLKDDHPKLRFAACNSIGIKFNETNNEYELALLSFL